MSFFVELRRRNVFKAAVAYAIVGWLLIEVSSTVFPVVQLPDWTVTFVTMLILLGFPIALVLSWAFELTPEGMRRSHEVAPEASIARATGQKLNYAIIGALVVALGFVTIDQYVLEESAAPPILTNEPVDAQLRESASDEQAVLLNSVAVLPLENLSPDPNNAYFAAGMHEEILNHLAKLRNLNVISRTSVVRYADSALSIPEIAAELNVETVMEGSVRYASDRVRVTVQLIDPETDAHLWSEVYDRDLADVFAIQADIAMNVANALEAEFSLAEQQSIEARATDSEAAYALYLRAIGTAAGPLGIPIVTQYLDEAIALDPDFALAYAFKAYIHADQLTGNAPAQQAEFERVVSENAERALALNPTLGFAHGALAFVHQANWRWDEAEQELEQGLQLSPNDTRVLAPYSRLKRYRGEYDESIRIARRAVELDPNWFFGHYQLGITYRYARDYDAAADSFRAALDLVPAFGNAHVQLGAAEVSRGNWADAERSLRLAEQIWGADIISIRIPQLANAYAQMGQRDEVERLFDALTVRSEDSPVNAAVWALMYIALEDYNQALEWLAVAIDDQAPDLVTLGDIKANPFSNPVLDEPRFQMLRDRIAR